MKQPDWLINHMQENKKPVVKEQITIIARGPMRREGLEKTMGGPISTSRQTGTGVDGRLQPGKLAGDVHEGEGVLSANAMQAIPADVFQALTKHAEQGTLDINALRAAVGQPAKPGYRTGSFGSAILPKPPIPGPEQQNTKEQQENQFGHSGGVNPQQPQKTQDDLGHMAPIVSYGTKPASSGLDFGTTGITGGVRQPVAAPTAPQTGTLELAPPTTQQESKIWQQVQTAPPVETNQQLQFAPGSVQGSAAGPGRWDPILNQSVQRTQGIAEGTSPVFKRMSNQSLRNYDTRAANDLAATEMTLATRSDMPENLKGSLLAQSMSGARSGRSELIGEMSADARNRMQAANTELANIATGQKSFEENKRQWQESFDETRRRAAVSDEHWNKEFQESQRRFGITQEQWQQEFSEGKIRWNDQKQQWERTFARDTDQITRQNTMQDIQTLISMGAAENIGAITEKFKSLGITINPAAILRTDKGKTFNDAMAQFTTLIATPGMTFENARAAMQGSGQWDVLATAFGGVEPQWTGDPAADPRTKARYSKPLTATDADWLIDNGYTLSGKMADNSSMRSLFSSLSSATNPIDAALNQIHSSDWYKGLSQDKRDLMDKFFTASLTGELLVKLDDKGNIVDINVQTPGTAEGQGGTTITIPTGKKNGDYFVGSDGNVYTVKNNQPVLGSTKDLVAAKDFGRLSELYGSAQDKTALLKDVPAAQFTLNTRTGTDTISTSLREGDIAKIDFGGGLIPVKVSRIGKLDNGMGFDDVFIEFVGPDGKIYSSYTTGGQVRALHEGAAPKNAKSSSTNFE